MPHAIEVSSEFQKRQEAIRKKLNQAAKGSDSEILQKQAKRENRERPEVQDNVRMVRMLVDEGIQMYESGDMSLSELVEDLHKSLMAVAGQKGKIKGMKEDSEEE